jgi:hypothetical protein
MAVDKARHEDAAVGIDDFGPGRRLHLWPDGGDQAVRDQHVTVGNDGQFMKFFAPARARSGCQGENACVA